jgi:hypothetical protein
VLWLLTTANILLGLAFSPITSAAKVRVVGALPSDQERIKNAVQAVKNKPALRGGAEKALEEIYRRPDLRSAKWSQNLFRRGLLELKYDRPVALLKGTTNTILTNTGQIAQTAEPIDGLPELALFPEALEPAAAFGSPYRGMKVADVCSRASSLEIANLWISVQANGAVCLNSGTTGRVLLGSPDSLDEKFEKLQSFLTQDPELLGKGNEIVLMVASRAVVRRLGAP